MIQQSQLDFSQRWENRREHRRLPGERINPAEYAVEVITGKRLPRQFVEHHHYSGSYPAAHCAVGLFRKTGVEPARLVGVAVFSEGVRSMDGMPHWTGFHRVHGTELGRLVLLPEVRHNGESWFITRAFEALRRVKPHFRVVLSYCDPMERMSDSGQVIKPGHFGSIYQAANALYVGQSSRKSLLMLPDGRILHPYTLHKALKRAKGWESAFRAIERAGGPQAPGEDVAAWLARVKVGLRKVNHPGNLVYVFGLDVGAWRTLRTMHGDGLPYPKARNWQIAA